MRKKSTKTTTEAIGYMCPKDALDRSYTQENLSCLTGKFGRPDELRKVRVVMENIKPGVTVRALICKYTYTGTVLGYRYNGRRGWVMGLLLQSGSVKDVSIDPRDWFDGENTHFTHSGKTVYAIYKHGYRLAIEQIN